MSLCVSKQFLIDEELYSDTVGHKCVAIFNCELKAFKLKKKIKYLFVDVIHQTI